MKKILFILGFVALFNSAFSQQWISQNPNPTGVGLNAVQMFSNNFGYMIGESGTFLKFNGTDWVVDNSFPFTGSMSAMCFLSENNGWVATYGGSIYHFDGTNWTKQFEDPSFLFFSIHLSDANNGWAVGFEGKVVKFDGTSWTVQESITEQTLWTVYCWDASHVWAAGNNELFFYNGVEWVAELEGAPCSFIDFHFNSLTDGIVYTNQALIYTYNGTSWTQEDINDGGFDDVEVISSTDIWAVTDLGSIWHYDGNIWNLVEEEIVPNYGSLFGLDFADATHGWAVGSNGNIYQYDGTEWTRYTEGFSVWLSDMDYADANNVWLVGDACFIYYYNGSEWSQQTCPIDEVDIKDIDVISENNVWALAGGSDEYILHYDGNEWTNQTTLTQYWVNGLEMINENLGWACASSGDIIKYDGTSWNTFASYTDTYFYNIDFASENNGWAGGYMGQKFYHYDGTAWSEYQLNGVSEDFQLQEFKFTSPTEGWAVGREKMSWTPAGYILHYDGTNWTVVLEVAESPFNGIEIINDTLGWAVGEQTYKYNGTEWLPWSDNLPSEVKSVCFTDTETGWAYGEDGLFYKFNPDHAFVGLKDKIAKQKFKINVYPNPSKDFVIIDTQGEFQQKDIVSVKIYDANGKLHKTNTNGKEMISVSDLKDGIYYIEIETVNRTFSSKFIKIR